MPWKRTLSLFYSLARSLVNNFIINKRRRIIIYISEKKLRASKYSIFLKYWPFSFCLIVFAKVVRRSKMRSSLSKIYIAISPHGLPIAVNISIIQVHFWICRGHAVITDYELHSFITLTVFPKKELRTHSPTSTHLFTPASAEPARASESHTNRNTTI